MSAPRRGGLGRGLGALIVDTTSRPAAADGAALAAARAPSATLPGPDAVRPGTAAASPSAGEPPLADDLAAGQSTATVAGTRYREVPVDAIEPNPRQPRTHVDEEPLAELAASVREVGLLQPVVVRETSPGRYELIMGERRWRACREAGLPQVPALVRETGDDALLRDALLENLHRVDLNPLDEAAAYGQLLDDFGATHEELASRVSRSRSHVTNTLRLLQLPPAVQRRVAAGVLSAGHARALLAVEDPEALEALASRIVAEGLSVRAVEEEVALLRSAGRRRPVSRRRAPTGGMQELSDVLSDRFETRVSVTMGRAKGRIVVEFASPEDLQRILATMAPGTAVADGDEGDENPAGTPTEDATASA